MHASPAAICCSLRPWLDPADAPPMEPLESGHQPEVLEVNVAVNHTLRLPNPALVIPISGTTDGCQAIWDNGRFSSYLGQRTVPRRGSAR